MSEILHYVLLPNRDGVDDIKFPLDYDANQLILDNVNVVTKTQKGDDFEYKFKIDQILEYEYRIVTLKLGNINLADYNINWSLIAVREIDFTGVNFHDAQLIDANFTDCNLTGINFTNCNLSGINFTYSTILTDADFTGVIKDSLTDAVFTNVNLSGADFTGVNLSNAVFTGANLSGADFTGVNLSNADFTSAIIDYIQLDSGEFFPLPFQSDTVRNDVATTTNEILYKYSKESLSGVIFDIDSINLDLYPYFDYFNFNFNGFNLTGVEFRNITSIDLSNITDAIVDYIQVGDKKIALPNQEIDVRNDVGNSTNGILFEYSKDSLSGVDFTDVDLRGINLSGFNFSGAKLTGAILNGADFTGAKLTGAILNGADFTGAILVGAIFDSVAVFDGAILNDAIVDYIELDTGEKIPLPVQTPDIRSKGSQNGILYKYTLDHIEYLKLDLPVILKMDKPKELLSGYIGVDLTDEHIQILSDANSENLSILDLRKVKIIMKEVKQIELLNGSNVGPKNNILLHLSQYFYTSSPP